MKEYQQQENLDIKKLDAEQYFEDSIRESRSMLERVDPENVNDVELSIRENGVALEGLKSGDITKALDVLNKELVIAEKKSAGRAELLKSIIHNLGEIHSEKK